MYKPGTEPEELKKYLNALLKELHAEYPDGMVDMERWNHNRWDKLAGYLVQKLGYRNGTEFLKAYGFDVYSGEKVQETSSRQKSAMQQPKQDTVTRSVRKKRCPYCGAQTAGPVCEYCGSDIEEHGAEKVLPQTAKTKSNRVHCQKCGSENVTFKRENHGEVRGKKSKAVIHRTVGVCSDCGYTWYVEDSETPLVKKRKTWLWVLGWLFIFPLPLTILLLRKKEMKPLLKYGLIAVAWIIYLLIALGGGSTTQTANTVNGTDIPTSAVTESKSSNTLTFIIRPQEAGEYGIENTLNAGTDLAETQIVYRIPAGSYKVTNLGNYPGQINAYSFETHVTSEGWEEPAYTGDIKVIAAGETVTFSIEDGFYVESHVNGDLRFEALEESSNSDKPQVELNALDKLGIPHETMVAIYSDISDLFNSDESPYLDVNASSEQIDDWENSIIQQVAAKYGVTAEQAETIYSYAGLGYLFHYNSDNVPKLHGTLENVTVNGTTVIVKVKINSSLTNEMTINQNYFNACDIIRSFGENDFHEFQYWAVADMSDGSESKVISFTVPRRMIERIATTQFADNQLGNYVEDLWILPSLLN